MESGIRLECKSGDLYSREGHGCRTDVDLSRRGREGGRGEGHEG